MSSRLIIDGNAVYEIDEECEEYPKKRGAGNGRFGGNSSEGTTGSGKWGQGADRSGTQGRESVKGMN